MDSTIFSISTEHPEPHPSRCWLYNEAQVPYSVAWRWQQSLVAARRDNPELEDVLILLEHPPVYTLGQGASLDFLKFDPTGTEFEVHRVERGGEVTYHCPGQLVGYPILNLRRHRQDLHWYLRQLEEVLIQVLETYGLKGERVAGFTGVWVEGRKVAAIGIKVSRWITMHGFALNVCPSLKGFERIVPCGISDKPVGSLAQFIPGIELDSVRQDVAAGFARVFNLQLIEQQARDQLF
ncbi:lipoyl(octanoyl) transferase LipB [Microcoleus sp. FACHB-68]|uniref:lipoyl(octanoyl) transferase LipB n=1 Tax=Microcoleus sp. FACHB-68 TaxID=2692826 RepID=UPI0016824C57|nr:lipoyl(octanoyl) transferase LipB [Microcoleus sp. FACHB-68]MBD1936964.1 lipoyl(octanoyl) transferase LipB [Microcoleus sp. FACHB-68]